MMTPPDDKSPDDNSPDDTAPETNAPDDNAPEASAAASPSPAAASAVETVPNATDAPPLDVTAAASAAPAPAPPPPRVAASTAAELPPEAPLGRDTYDYGELSDVPWTTRFLWSCAGADAQLLLRCPNSDRVKFQGLGGVVLTVGVLAFFSGSYAFYTVFSPKEATALDLGDAHLPSVVAAVFFGLVWSLIIFNIDRFIISSTGKGDGTEKITWPEFQNALPRLAMALIIGLCLSKPLEIKILESEIESQLETEQKKYLADLNAQSEGLVAKERARLRETIDALQSRIDERETTLEKRRLEIKQQGEKLELEAEGKTGSGKAGRGPAWRDKKRNLTRLEAELERDREKLNKKNALAAAELSENKATLEALDERLAKEKATNEKVARHLDGLMKRIQISHEIGGWIPFAIMLLLLCIEAGPIFFKLMVIKGAYDYLEENQKRLARARMGIEPDAVMLAEDTGKNVLVDLHHGVNALIAEEKRRYQTEQELAETVHATYRARMKKDIERDPTPYLESPRS